LNKSTRSNLLNSLQEFVLFTPRHMTGTRSFTFQIVLYERWLRSSGRYHRLSEFVGPRRGSSPNWINGLSRLRKGHATIAGRLVGD
jgi:hypothetical protein